MKDSNGHRSGGGEEERGGADDLNGTSSSSDNKESANSSSYTDLIADTYDRLREGITNLSGDAQSVAHEWLSSASSMLEGETADQIVSAFHSLQGQWDEQSPITKKVVIGAGVVRFLLIFYCICIKRVRCVLYVNVWKIIRHQLSLLGSIDVGCIMGMERWFWFEFLSYLFCWCLVRPPSS